MKLLLVDGHAILHRAYHALPPLTNSSNKPTGAIYGFLSILIRTLHNIKPTHLVVCFDRKEPTFRKKLLTTYQAHRPVLDDTFISQITSLHEILEKIGIVIFEASGFEADDVIGTLAKQTGDNEAVIITGDRDILQLVNDKIRVLMPVAGLSQAKLFGEAEVLERMGVIPSKIIDLKALIGDAADNYFGVPGIGPKTAVALIEKYGNFENIYKNIDKIEGKLKEKLEKGKVSAVMSKTLATIVCDVPVKLDWNKSKLVSFDRPDIHQLFEEWGFRSLILRLGGDPPSIKVMAGKVKKIEKKVNVEQTSLF